MDPTVLRLTTLTECNQFIENGKKDYPHLVQQARRRAIQLQAIAYGATTDAERDALETVFAYEQALFLKHGKRQQATYTRRSIKNRGILGAIEHAVLQSKDTTGYTALDLPAVDLDEPSAAGGAEERFGKVRHREPPAK